MTEPMLVNTVSKVRLSALVPRPALLLVIKESFWHAEKKRHPAIANRQKI